ncbi:uncharacterized protein LOC125237120 [Leguminivora glycinivorella]|uniref:uncharacterized protein LOC125237120 n=1 Tax=Leguminivora glycinivorella TaxID=1035111 RepID=UPI00200D7486|nr:uncharacterized protein LOC125237120 [Leguminivora glycinivorella]
MSLIKKIQLFLSYWYQRYLLATELYMVEPWEKVVIHIVFAVLLTLFWWFNKTLVVGGISSLRNTASVQAIS